MDIERKLLEELRAMVGEDFVKRKVIKSCLTGLNEEQRSIVRLVRCCDCKNGLRFGKVAKRIGRCQKVGTARKQDGEKYQIWLDWSGTY